MNSLMNDSGYTEEEEKEYRRLYPTGPVVEGPGQSKEIDMNEDKQLIIDSANNIYITLLGELENTVYTLATTPYDTPSYDKYLKTVERLTQMVEKARIRTIQASFKDPISEEDHARNLSLGDHPSVPTLTNSPDYIEPPKAPKVYPSGEARKEAVTEFLEELETKIEAYHGMDGYSHFPSGGPEYLAIQKLVYDLIEENDDPPNWAEGFWARLTSDSRLADNLLDILDRYARAVDPHELGLPTNKVDRDNMRSKVLAWAWKISKEWNNG